MVLLKNLSIFKKKHIELKIKIKNVIFVIYLCHLPR